MFTVYVLYSEKYKKIYIGQTNDIKKRFESHNEFGNKGWTIQFRRWKIVHTEVFETRGDAMRREKELKSARGREWIWNLLDGT
jgi:putative endonuclease